MKQFIVLVTTIILGIALAAMILGFKQPAQNLSDNVTNALNSTIVEYSSNGAIANFPK